MSSSKKQSTGAMICGPVGLISLLIGIYKIPILMSANTYFFDVEPRQRDWISLYKTEGSVGRVQSLLYIFCCS